MGLTSLFMGISKRGTPGVLGSAMVRIGIGEDETRVLMATPQMAREIATRLNQLADEAEGKYDA